jgi:hypothetical protein
VPDAGHLVWRRDADGRVRVLVAHRPLHDDWVLPDGESPRALGLRCALGRALGGAYTSGAGRPELRRYLAWEAEGGALAAPRGEIDELRWVELGRAPRVLSYPREVGAVESLRALLAS